MEEPTLPYDLNNERSVLGACLLDRDAISVIRDVLSVDDFFLEKHGQIYAAMIDLVERRIPPDLTTVAGRLRERGQLESAGGISYLGDLLTTVPSAVHVEHYARLVLQASGQRRIIQLGAEIQIKGHEGGDMAQLFEQLRLMIELTKEASSPKANWQETVIAAKILFKQTFEVIPPTVEHILPAGTMLLAGKPKTRKSWLALNIALAVASGGKALGHFQALQGDVLYIDLEMGPARLHKRLHVVLPEGQEPPKGLHFATKWPPVGEGFEPWLRDYLKARPFTRLVVVDTMVGIRPPRKRYEDPYESDKRFLQTLTNLCHEFPITILLVHHSRKADGTDITDVMLGTNGLSGGADNCAVLSLADGGKLVLQGRDIEIDGDLSLKWDARLAQWNYSGEANAAPKMTSERRAVVDLLSDRPGLTYKQIATILGRHEAGTARLLKEMADAGLVEKVSGAWFVTEGED